MKKRILCFGDSNTWGYNGAGGGRFDEETRWTARLQSMLGEGYTVIEEGQNGRTTVWTDPVENRMAGFDYLWPCMESQHPFDLIIIMLGTNDTKTYFGCEAVSIANGAGRLVKLAQQSDFGPEHTSPKVLLVAPVLIDKEGGYPVLFGEQAARKSKDFAEEFERVAKERGCEFLDAARYAEVGKADGLHLDAENHGKLAKAMYDKVLSILE